jgi:FG-GAP-like repeat/Immunoglobulin domain/IPT/TIG domain
MNNRVFLPKVAGWKAVKKFIIASWVVQFAFISNIPAITAHLQNLSNIPVITSFSPQSGTIGTTVNVSGLNFDPVAGNDTVYFGAVQAIVTAASVTNLTVRVPVSATFAPITVTVNGLTAYAQQPFLPTFPGIGQINGSSLAPLFNLGTGNGPGRVVIADMEGDGKPDLIIADSYAGEISIYHNISTNGSLTAGSFGPRVDLPVRPTSGDTPYTLVVADLDGDGKPDIITLDSDSNLISIFRNMSSSGSITTNSFAARIDIPAGDFMLGLAVQDLNGDGKPEIMAANYGDNTISIFQNLSTIGNIAFAPRVDFVTGNGPEGVAIGDLDGDGNPDLAVLNTPDGTVSVLRNLGVGGNITTNSFAPRVNFPTLASPYPIAIGDMDGDGKLDLVVGGNNASRVISVFRNTSTAGSIATNSFASRVDFAAPGWVNYLVLADLDGAGKLDVMLVSQISSVFSIFKNVSTPGSFTTASLAARVDYPSGYNPIGISIGDLDGDGRPDVVFANQYDNNISVYHNLVPIIAAPVITTQPTNQTVAVGTPASFSVSASGTTPFLYQWSFNTTILTRATNATLTLNNVQLTNAGLYSVTVSNLYGGVISSNATLTVNDVLDHFVWNQIPSPRFLNVPFTVTIQAQDVINAPFTNFIGTVNLTSTNGIAVNPHISANFIQGTWTGSLTITQATSNLTLRADDGFGHFGLANSISVVNLPGLGALPSGNFLLVFWPIAPTGFVLETSSSLSSTQWIQVLNPPLQIGDQYLQLMQMNQSNQFFRLRFPNL